MLIGLEYKKKVTIPLVNMLEMNPQHPNQCKVSETGAFFGLVDFYLNAFKVSQKPADPSACPATFQLVTLKLES